MEKYFLIKNEIKKDNEIKGNVFTSSEIKSKSSDYSYTLISKNVLHKMLNAEMMRVDDEIRDIENNFNLKSYIKEPRIKELKDRIDVVVKRYTELMENNADTVIENTDRPMINVFLSSLSDPEFLEDNKELLNTADLNVILNETEMNTIYRGQNIITLEDTLSGKFDDTDFTQKRKEYKDENATIDKYNLISGEYLKEIQKQIKPKSIIVKESFDSENEYTIDELDIANRKIEEVAKIINSQKELSPYEKFYLAFRYVAKYEYKEYKNSNKEISRNLIDVLNSDYIVCAGKANLLKAICDRIGIPCIHRGAELHAICTIGMNDPKYGIYGLQTVDPTNQFYPVMYNEENEFPKNVFVNNMNWISELTYRQRDYLIEASGLFDVSEEKIKKSAEAFKVEDENLFYIDKKSELISNKYYLSQNKNKLESIASKCTEVKKNYDKNEDITVRWLEVENTLKSFTNNEDEMLKNILKRTDACKLAKSLIEDINNLEDTYLHFFTDEKQFLNDCKMLQIDPNNNALDEHILKFEKTIIPRLNEIIKNMKNYASNYDKIIDSEIKLCEEKITNELKLNRFIPVSKDTKKIESLIDEVRINHLENKIAQLGE